MVSASTLSAALRAALESSAFLNPPLRADRSLLGRFDSELTAPLSCSFSVEGAEAAALAVRERIPAATFMLFACENK